jgi:hypothetical protein
VRAHLGVRRKRTRLLLVATGAAVVAVLSAAEANGSSRRATDVGALELRAVFNMKSVADLCPDGAYPPSVECKARTGAGVVPGLGNVTETYTFAPDFEPGASCPGGLALRGSSARFAVAGKGEIDLSIAGSTDCFNPNSILAARRSFTVTGGSGAYSGASGSGTLQHEGHLTAEGAAGTDTWTGTLAVPGLAFDVVAPTLSGARGKTVRAPLGKKTIRVRFTVTAQDVDGSLPVACKPPSGSRFKVGRTRVTCSATDRSGNTTTAKFTVTVKPG